MESPEVPTYDRVIELLRKNVENMGADYVYKPVAFGPLDTRTCVYFYNQQPSCIVGHLLADLGVVAFGNSEKLNVLGSMSLLDALYGDQNIDDKTQELLASVQQRQDSGMPWGEALEGAIESVEFDLKRMKD